MDPDNRSELDGGRASLPIETGFPIRQVNDIAQKEGYGGARQWFRPVYTMHKWWARRLGSVFRSICLYSLIDDPDKVSVHEPGSDGSISDYTGEETDIEQIIANLDITNQDSLWEIYPKDVRISDKKILDPFMGGGTTLVEASRFGVQSVGYDLNPVAWFVTKCEIEASQVDLNELANAYDKIEDRVAKKLKSYYKTPCPNSNDHQADVMNSLWVKEVDCVDCGEEVSLFGDYRVGKGRYENSGEYNVYCPDCESVILIDDWQSESECSECGYNFVPKDGPVSGSSYACDSCGSKYSITDAIEEQGGFRLNYHAIEYHCPTCDDNPNRTRAEAKSYRSVSEHDKQLFSEAKQEWESTPELHEYVPSEEIPVGHMTAERNDVFAHGYSKWTDMFNERQLLCFSLLLREIDQLDSESAKEYLLLAFSDMLRYRSMMNTYKLSSNQLNHIFKTNSFDPPTRPAEGNVWGADYGTGTFQSLWDMVVRGVNWCKAPTDRYIEYPDKDGYPNRIRNRNLSEPETVETKPFNQPVGNNTEVKQGDVRKLEEENEFDAVITDPPYYNNIIYSELSDYFYVWQKVILEDKYEAFTFEHTSRAESIVANPAEGKGDKEFEEELWEAFSSIHTALKQDGVLTFTYHHSSSESWGELLTALCDVGFEVTATYPISADVSKFIEGESVEFDIIIVARPAGDRDAISWNSLRRNIYRTAQKTRQSLEGSHTLSRGDIGVVEMGRCFHEYSKHHGKVERAGELMTAKEVVDEIYGVIQHGSDIGEVDVFLDLLETPGTDYNELDKLTRGTNATPERMKDMLLYNMENGFELGTWDNEQRLNYIQRRVDKGEELTDLDKAQFLRYRWEHGKSVTEYLEQWEITDNLRELCEGLADATGDDTYRNILESRLSDF